MIRPAVLFCAAVLCGGLTAAQTNSVARAKVAPAVPAAPVVAVVAAVPEAQPVHVSVADVLAAELAKATSADVPRLLEVALAKATSAEVPRLLEVALARVAESDAQKVAAAVYAAIVRVTTPSIEPAELVRVQAEWYERFKATPSSKAWWILRVARERAARGEPVEKLKQTFDATMRAWLEE